MTVTTLSSSAISAQAIFGLNDATRTIADSTQRLSSGSRFANAGDDVGALAVSNKLNSQVISLRQAQTNNLQANSLLQTAYSGAIEINDILDAMKALAVQGNSGTLTAVERATLDVEFQGLKDQIDSIANSTSFNDLNVLDGSISGINTIESRTTNATQSSATITITSPFAGGETIRVNGNSLVANVEFALGADATDQATQLFNALSTSSKNNLSKLNYQLVGDSIIVTAAGGELGNNVTVDDRVAVATGAGNYTVSGVETSTADLYRLTGGDDDGMFLGSTRVTGTTGDAIAVTQDQTYANVSLTITDNSNIDDFESFLTIDDGSAAGTVTFTARTGAAANSQQFTIGATAEETLQNFVSAVENYSTSTDQFVLNQLEFEIENNVLEIRGKQTGLLLDQELNTATISTGLAAATEGSISGTTFNNGTDDGVNTFGLTNPDFLGTISGFSATYNSNDNITASITVGSSTYSATFDTTPGVDTAVTFGSSDGGYFTVELESTTGVNVTDQTGADTYAARLDAVFSTLEFTQERYVSSFNGAGQLGGGYATFRSADFTNTSISNISVTDSSTNLGNALVDFTIGGERFVSNNLGSSIGADETVYFRSTTNSENYLAIRNGSTAIDLSNAAAATTFNDTLRSNFNLDGNGNGALSFQVGTSSSDAIAVNIGSATSDSLLDGATPDLTSQANAIAAETVIDGALEEITTIIASIGASQARLDYSYNANSSIITELDYARGILADTDIPSESTIFAEAVVQQQSAIAVLAQTQQLSSNLLSLLEAA